MARAFLFLTLLPAGGCFLPAAGGIHRQGEKMAIARIFTGNPITGKALAWEGEARVPNEGVGVYLYYFPEDRVAIGSGVNYTRYRGDDGGQRSLDLEARLRYYAFEVAGASVFADLSGGYLIANESLPPVGTRTNYTFAFGPGVDVPLGGDVSLVLGGEFHHFSNARGSAASDNPSQNEFLLWAGLGFRW